jgi:O-antigen/teichoic acid export membrane protein
MPSTTGGDGPDVTPAGMQAHGGRIARSILALSAGEFVARIIGFGATIYVARRLGVEAYGIIGVAFALMLYASAVADLGLEQLGPREIADREGPLGPLVSSVLLARLAISTAMAAILAIGGLLFLTKPEGSVLAIYALVLLAVGANAKWAHVGLGRSGIVSAARIVAESVKVVGVIVFVHDPSDILFVPLAQVAGDGLGTLILLVALPGAGIRPRFEIDRTIVRTVFSHARPLLLTSLLSLLIYNADVVMLRIFHDRTEVGLYLVAYTLINFIGALGNIITISLLPTLRRLRDNAGPRDTVYHTTVAQALTAGLPIAAGGSLLAPQILGLVFGDEYGASAGALRILIWSFPLLLLRSVEQGALIAAGRQDRVLRTTAVAATINVSLNLVAVPLFGMIGAAVTTVIAEGLRMAVSRHYAIRSGYGASPVALLWKPAAATLAMAAALVIVRPTAAIPGVILGAVAFVAALAVVGGIGWVEGRPVLRV